MVCSDRPMGVLRAPMSDSIPRLTPTERAMLEQFRVEQSPHPAVSDRVMHALQLQIGAAPIALQSPWWLWLRAGGLSFALAAGTLVVLGGTARVLGRATAPAPMAAADATAVDAPQETANVPALQEADTAVVAPALPVAPPPVAPAAPADAAASEPVETALDRGRARTDAGGRGSASRPARPVDAAAEIAAFRSIKLEPSAQARLAAITRYRDEFAAGTFVQEVAVLELQTLCALGRTEDAARRGAAFVRSFGDSAYAAIARRGCTEAPR